MGIWYRLTAFQGAQGVVDGLDDGLRNDAMRLIISQLQGIGMHTGIDGRSRNAFIHKMRHLVFHQRNERRDDQAKAIQQAKKNMEKAVKEMDFLAAAKYRDEMLQWQIEIEKME